MNSRTACVLRKSSRSRLNVFEDFPVRTPQRQMSIRTTANRVHEFRVALPASFSFALLLSRVQCTCERASSTNSHSRFSAEPARQLFRKSKSPGDTSASPSRSFGACSMSPSAWNLVLNQPPVFLPLPIGTDFHRHR
jgi:hypothetical protein